jgi:PIN domain nuclease of toxin-antitoxin system
MSKLVLDSWAWIEYFEGSKKGEKVKQVLLDPRDEVFTHSVSLAEIISKAKRTGMNVDEVWTAVTGNSNVIEGKVEESKNVGITHATIKSRNRNFSLADAFVLAAARKIKAKVLTADPDFKNIENAIML